MTCQEDDHMRWGMRVERVKSRDWELWSISVSHPNPGLVFVYMSWKSSQLLNPQNSCSKTAVSGPERWQRPENYRFDQDRQSPKHQSLDHWVYCASEGLGFNIQDSNLLKKYVFYFTYSHWVWRLLLIGGRQDGRHKTYFNKLTTLHKFAQMKAAEVATII